MTTMLITAIHLLFQHNLVVQSVYIVPAFSAVPVTTSIQLNITEGATVLFTGTLRITGCKQEILRKIKLKTGAIPF